MFHINDQKINQIEVMIYTEYSELLSFSPEVVYCIENTDVKQK